MKKSIATVLCMALAFTLVGCGAKITGASLTAPPSISVGEAVQAEIKLDFDKEVSAEDVAEQQAKLPLVWSSSDDKIATVDENGKITGVAGGEVEISVTFEENTAACKITVTIPATGVKAPETLALAINGEAAQKLDAKPIPENANVASTEYKSSDESIATVSADGTVTAVKNGEIVITTTMDGFTAETKVTVSTAPTAISFENEGGILYVGGSVTLKATLTPAEASDTPLVWKSSDESIATVKDGKIVAVKVGNATITAATADGKVKAEYKLVVKTKPAANTNTNKGSGNNGTGSTGSTGSGNAGGDTSPPPSGGNAGDTTPPPAPPAPPAEPQHYHGNGSDKGICPACGLVYSTHIPLDPDAGNDQGDLSPKS